ncbi:MAG: group II intron reverse transcriptase/maturase [Hespellia sp.]|nr:group II intron reverse transcriptase/maturase [Hespellia sp.]
MGTKLERIAEISAESKKPVFTSVYHLINVDLLKQCHKELDGKKAVGVDKVTKEEYGKNLDRNIEDLVQRLKNKSFKPLPSLRVYIPKGNGKMRPLGIASYEDKIVQMEVKKVLEAVYEPRFLNCMYGFRPNRGCHEAVKEVYQRISYGKISYIVDADIKGFFDHINHDWMMRFLEWHIQDPNLLWLIKKYLKAGIMEDGKIETTEEGSAQGSVMSPILANIYMHNVLTLWFKFVVRKTLKGDCFLVNFADDFVAGFQYKSEAEWYYSALKERMGKFNLELESSKSRLIEFGRFAETNRLSKGEGKPETFDFLGYTFYCGKTRKGIFAVKLQTSRKKFERKLKEYKHWIYDNRNRPVREIIKELNVKLVGHYRYYGVTWNYRRLCAFLHRVQQFLFKAVNRRGCRRAYTWGGYWDMLKCYPLAKPKTYYSLY